MKKRYAVINVQLLVEVTENELDKQENVKDWGYDWLTEFINVQNTEWKIVDYRHPKIMGQFLRPFEVGLLDEGAEDIFTDENVYQVD